MTQPSPTPASVRTASRRHWAAVLLAAIGGGVVGTTLVRAPSPAVAAPASAAPVTRWEYKTLDWEAPASDVALTREADGWELVAVAPHGGPDATKHTLYLRRPSRQ